MRAWPTADAIICLKRNSVSEHAVARGSIYAQHGQPSHGLRIPPNRSDGKRAFPATGRISSPNALDIFANATQNQFQLLLQIQKF